jgi:hypothetical protein
VAVCLKSLRKTTKDRYQQLWLAFGPAVIGTVQWRDSAGASDFSSLVTVSDEAFLLLVLDNYMTRWDAMTGRLAAGYTMVRQQQHCLVQYITLYSHICIRHSGQQLTLTAPPLWPYQPLSTHAATAGVGQPIAGPATDCSSSTDGVSV